MLDWEEGDRFSFEDSDRFEEDSLCSWSSEPESLCNNWRGWKRPAYANGGNYNAVGNKKSGEDGGSNKSSSGTPPNLAAPSTSNASTNGVASLTELCARCVASHIPFELVERVFPPVPEQLQLRIAFWSFPDNEEDIRLYSCLANGSADEFQRGDNLFRIKAVKDPLQIGFHLSATVNSVQPRGQFNVAVTFDRRRISSCNCTCTSLAYWCSHIVAVCLHRIHCPNQVCLRAPVSESLQQLQRDQLQKFAQYLISELPQQILPTAQRLLDELLSSQPTKINTVCGAPDPTAGASASDQTSWYLDTKTLHDNIKKILIKFCVPAPIVFSDVNYLSTTAPPAAAEWSSLLRPLRGREPEGMWNLLSIVREMFKRTDRNAIPLLDIITEECMACDQILVWWFSTRVALMSAVSGGGGSHGGGGGHSGRGGQSSNSNGGAHSNAHASQHACSSLCDEIVVLWRLAAQNPALAPKEREMLKAQFIKWHLRILDKVVKARGSSTTTTTSSHKLSASHHHNNSHHHNHHHHHHHHGSSGSGSRPLSDLEVFTGFKPAIEACHLDWDDYPIPGVTHSADTNPVYHCPFTCFKKPADSGKGDVNQVNSSQVVLSNQHPQDHYRHNHPKSLGRMDLQQWRHHQPCNTFRGFSEARPTHSIPSTSTGANIACSSTSSALPASASSTLPSGSLSYHHHPNDGNRSSVSSEGFCENDDGTDSPGCGGIATNNESAVTSGSSNSSANNSSDSNSSASCERTAGARLLKTRESLMKTLDRSGGGGSSSDDSDSNKRYARPVASTSGAGSNHSNKSAGSSSKDESDNNSNNKHPELTRRDSKDDSVSSSESQMSGDEYSHYYYDPKALQSVQSTAGTSKDKTMDQQLKDIFNNIKMSDDAWEILFARAEGLHAHGHGREACILGVKLAEELLANPPDLMVEIPQIQRKKGKKHHINPASHQLSVLASATLAKCAFLCTVLAENQEHSLLAFKVGLFGLELPRPPASTKPLEVKLANQESDLVNLLKRITLGPVELSITRERAKQLKEGTLRSRGEALLPIMLASFIFEALSNGKSKNVFPWLPTDEALGFEAAVAALGLKANVSEADHPLLCEGTRRQRGDLALVLLNHYKQEPNKIARIMDKLLDREIHQLIKTPILSSYYSSNPPIRSRLFSMRQREEHNDQFVPHMYSWEMQQLPQQPSRPHSSTSAELDNVGMCNLSISGTSAPTSQVTTSQITSTRSKESRYKGKRAYPSIPNQPSEASAHFMFELAKSVLTKAGGNSSTSLFTQASTTQNHHGPHRALHMCAFQLGLYALGLHNCVSSNWLSRTYSSHVSWIIGQAMEIGAPAISFLIDTWEGHLTPPEAVTIADRASQNCDANMVRAAAELALSCLPHAQALNPNEIQRAILQCKEQSDVMLERACVTVESVAKGGGVYPEVLFQVARYWYDLYVILAPGDAPHQGHAPNPDDVMCAGIAPLGAGDSLVALVVEPTPQDLIPMAQLQQPPPMVTTSAPVVSSQQQQQMVAQPMPLAMPPSTSGMPQQPIPVSVVQQQQQQQQQVVVNQVSLPLPLPMPVPPPVQQAGQNGGAGVPGGVVVTGAPPMPPPGAHMQYAPSPGVVTPYAAAAAAAALYHNPQLAAAVAAHHHHQQQQQHQQQQHQHQQHQMALHHHHQQHQQHVAFHAHQQQQAQQPPPQVYHLQQARQFQYPPPPMQQYVPPIQYYSTPVLRPALPYQPQQAGQPQGTPGLLALPSLPPPPGAQNLRPGQMPGSQQPPTPNNRARNGLTPGSSNVPPPQYPHAQLRHLLAAYRVGMLALETLARRVHDDRPQAKYARNPPYGEDVKWLLRVSKRLGTQYLQQFCVCVVNSIVSPFVLHDVALEAAHYLSRNNPGLIMQHLRSALTPLVQKCQQMYIQCMHQKLYHLTLDDYEDFVAVVCAARQAFHITPEGNAQFKEWLQSIRRSKSCKKDLWTQINAALQANGGK